MYSVTLLHPSLLLPRSPTSGYIYGWETVRFVSKIGHGTATANITARAVDNSEFVQSGYKASTNGSLSKCIHGDKHSLWLNMLYEAMSRIQVHNKEEPDGKYSSHVFHGDTSRNDLCGHHSIC